MKGKIFAILVNMELQVELEVRIAKHGRRFVAYSPALDLSTSGKTAAEAKKRFGEIVPLFFEELVGAGTFQEVLRELGWKRENARGRSMAGWKPPIAKNESVRVGIPVAA